MFNCCVATEVATRTKKITMQPYGFQDAECIESQAEGHWTFINVKSQLAKNDSQPESGIFESFI